MSWKSLPVLDTTSPLVVAGGAESEHGSESVGNGALLRPGEVAALFRVDPKTVSRWAKAGKLSTVRTLGGHRRFREAEIRALVAQPPEAVPVVPFPGGHAS